MKKEPSTSGFVAEAVAATPIDAIVEQLNRGDYGWETEAPVTFTFAQSLPSYANGKSEYYGFGSFNERQMEMARLALSTWEDVADVDFTETYNDGGQIRFANSTHLSGFAAAHAYLPSSADWGGDVWINSSKIYNLIPTIGSYGLHVLIHEIGHAIGQLHPGDYNASNGVLSYQKDAAYFEDSGQYTIMSYWDETNTGADFGHFYSQTPMLHDVAAIQAKYGANLETRNDNTVYGFNTNVDNILFDFSKNKYPVLSIWDAGGVDTLDLSGFQTRSVVDLNPGEFSSLAGLTKNVSIAYGADIENAITGVADDVIAGNSLDNVIDAGKGHDIFVIDVEKSLAHLYVFDDGQIVVMSSHGTDQLTNVEAVEFKDDAVEIETVSHTSILEYAASYDDLAAAFGADKDLLYAHFIEYGLAEGRSISFSALDYVASYDDLVSVIGNDSEAGALHFIQYGRDEGRDITFDQKTYLENNPEFAQIVGSSRSAAEIYIDRLITEYGF